MNLKKAIGLAICAASLTSVVSASPLNGPKEIIDHNAVPVCGTTSSTFCRAVVDFNAGHPEWLDYLMDERAMIVGVAERKEGHLLREASRSVLENWPGGVMKDVTMFSQSEKGDPLAMAMIRDRYPLFFYTFASSAERVAVAKIVASCGGHDGVADAYRAGFNIPGESDSLMEVEPGGTAQARMKAGRKFVVKY